MVKSAENNGSVVPPFLLKCYEMVDDQSTDSVISWSSLTGDSFVISDVTEFETELLPKYFKHKNFSSFIRQLNIYVSFLFLVLLFLGIFIWVKVIDCDHAHFQVSIVDFWFCNCLLNVIIGK
ncbi:hypothetical protein CsSME_00043061 [Camellia sinensis var. sinensis]